MTSDDFLVGVMVFNVWLFIVALKLNRIAIALEKRNKSTDATNHETEAGKPLA